MICRVAVVSWSCEGRTEVELAEVWVWQSKDGIESVV